MSNDSNSSNLFKLLSAVAFTFITTKYVQYKVEEKLEGKEKQKLLKKEFDEEYHICMRSNNHIFGHDRHKTYDYCIQMLKGEEKYKNIQL